MKRSPRRNLLITLASACALFACGAAEAPCKLTEFGTVNVAAVRDGRTLMLTDGRELQLAAIGASDNGRTVLQTLVRDRTLRLERLGTEQDRYGRLLAFAFVDGAPQSLQQALLEQGLARVSAPIGDKACADTLLTTEYSARAAGRGLWADPNFAPLRAENLDKLQAERGHFAPVKGKVLSARESGATIYVNFGWPWTQHFTVIIPKRLQQTFAAVSVEPKQLEGRRIRVRSGIEQRGGPAVLAEAPEQIEFVE